MSAKQLAHLFQVRQELELLFVQCRFMHGVVNCAEHTLHFSHFSLLSPHIVLLVQRVNEGQTNFNFWSVGSIRNEFFVVDFLSLLDRLFCELVLKDMVKTPVETDIEEALC